MAAPPVWAVESCPRDQRQTPRRPLLLRALGAFGAAPPPEAYRRLFAIEAPPSPPLAAAVARLAADPLLATAAVPAADGDAAGWTIDLLPHPGVTDAEGDSLSEALARAGFAGVRVRSGHRYRLPAGLAAEAVAAVAAALVHPVVERAAWYRLGDPPDDALMRAFIPAALPSDAAEIVPIRRLADVELQALSRERLLALSVDDLRAVQAHFAALGREPTDVELETIAQTWSEHCGHRTFKATIRHEEPGRLAETIPGLLRSYVAAATARVARPWVLSAFAGNAGIVAFDADWELSVKVETHNHPSALEPFGGANTGVGGVVRDVLGVSAEPIATTDVLCFGPLDLPPDDLPPGAPVPRHVCEGVVAGIADYGNKMGIPTVNGAVLFDRGYAANPLVFCGTVGLAPRNRRPEKPNPGDLVVVAGGRAGRDGIHGATFSSEVLAADASATLGAVVQIGDPIVEKRLADALPVARDLGLYSAITDCGAGGLSSAVGEMAASLGADVDLAKVPLKYPGLRPWEIWLSEAQERMVLAVPPDKWERLTAVFAAEGVEATAIGAFTGDGLLRVRVGTRPVAELDCRFLHDGAPVRFLESRWDGPPAPVARPPAPPAGDLTRWLERLLADPNVASKEAIVRRYDHEVQGRTIGKPFVGPADLGPADGAVLQPLPDSRRGVAVGCGINPWYGQIDPYAMALLVVDEALRNVVALGADPARTAILDNFCWGNPNLPDRLGGLVRAAKGCHDAAVGLRLPFVSGKDSLNNEYRTPDGASHPIPGTLLVTAVGIVPDVARRAASFLTAPGNLLYLVGATGDDLGGSLFWRLHRRSLGDRAPLARPAEARPLFAAVHRAIRSGLVRAGHDLSEGGLAVAAAEMAIGGGFGVEIDLGAVPAAGPLPAATLLFAESPSRFLLEVAPVDAPALERVLGKRPWGRVGRVLAEPVVRVLAGGAPVIAAEVARLREVWRAPLAEVGA